MKKNQQITLVALRVLKELHSEAPSIQLANYLSSLKTAKDYTPEVFIEGVEAFTKVANLNPAERIQFYGNPFGGLHYNNDLADLWTQYLQEKIPSYQFDYLCPQDWMVIFIENCSALVYKGNTPSQALDKLIQGPTVIDCGQFCQLSLWFAFRYVLGDAAFNQIFGNTPLYITHELYLPSNHQQKFAGNPLYSFFRIAESKAEKTADLCIIHVANVPEYHFKHLGGNSNGENCIIIRGAFTIFGPTLPITSNLQRSDVEQLLRKALNAPQDHHNLNRLALFRTRNPASLHPSLLISYGDLIQRSEAFSHYTLKESEFKSKKDRRLHLSFDFEKFFSWIRRMEQNYLFRCLTYLIHSYESQIKRNPHKNQNQFDKRFGLILYQSQICFHLMVMHRMSIKKIPRSNEYKEAWLFSQKQIAASGDLNTSAKLSLTNK